MARNAPTKESQALFLSIYEEFKVLRRRISNQRPHPDLAHAIAAWNHKIGVAQAQYPGDDRFADLAKEIASLQKENSAA